MENDVAGDNFGVALWPLSVYSTVSSGFFSVFLPSVCLAACLFRFCACLHVCSCS